MELTTFAKTQLFCIGLPDFLVCSDLGDTGHPAADLDLFEVVLFGEREGILSGIGCQTIETGCSELHLSICDWGFHN